MQARVIGWIRISTVYAGVAAAVMALLYQRRYWSGGSTGWKWIWQDGGMVDLYMIFAEFMAIALVCAAICLAPNIVRKLK